MNENLNNDNQTNTEPVSTNPASEELTNSVPSNTEPVSTTPVSGEPTNPIPTSEKPTPKKSNKGLLIVVIVILLAAAIVAIYMFLIKKNENGNDQGVGDGNIVDCFDAERNEDKNFNQQQCITNNINAENYYTKNILLSKGFNEVSTSVDTSRDITKSSSDLKKIATTNKVEIPSLIDGKKLALIELNNGVATLSYYNKEEVATKQQTINNVVSMSYENDLGVYDRYVFLVDSNGDCYKLNVKPTIDVDKIYNNQFTGLLFEKVTTVSNINEVYYLFNYSTTSGADVSYLVKTKDNAYKYIDDAKVYDTNTYKVISENGKIMNNRDIYLNGEVQSYKFKMEYTDGALKDKVQYILTTDNYLYDANLRLVYDKKVSSILVKNYYVITIFEDGKNIAMDSIEIK